METYGGNSFLLGALGVVCFVMSFMKGKDGSFRQSVVFAVLAAGIGILRAIDGGILDQSGREQFAVLFSYLLLSALCVMVSRRLFEDSQSGASQ